MCKIGLLFVAIIMAGCSSSSGSGDAPTDCRDIPPLKGGYMVTYTRISGTCPEIPQGLVVFGSSSSSRPDCRTDAAEVSEDKCSISMREVCTQAEISSQIRAASQDGSRLTGTITVRGAACSGTYSMTAVKQ